MNKINFSHNWNNKLNCNVFTTIRKSTGNKLSYYYNLLDKEFNIILNGKEYCMATLRDLTVLRIENINPMLLEMDVGVTDRGQALEIFKKFGIPYGTDVMILQLERIRR